MNGIQVISILGCYGFVLAKRFWVKFTDNKYHVVLRNLFTKRGVVIAPGPQQLQQRQQQKQLKQQQLTQQQQQQQPQQQPQQQQLTQQQQLPQQQHQLQQQQQQQQQQQHPTFNNEVRNPRIIASLGQVCTFIGVMVGIRVTNIMCESGVIKGGENVIAIMMLNPYLLCLAFPVSVLVGNAVLRRKIWFYFGEICHTLREHIHV